jgi:hypothetical protein
MDTIYSKAFPGIHSETGKETKKHYALFLLIVTALFSGCLAPDNAYLMDLNRNGKWLVAEKTGLKMLENGHTFTHSELCETFFHVIYAETRLGKTKEAVQLMNEYDKFSVKAPANPDLLWLDREIIMLKKELGLLSEVQSVIVRAMEENGNGNYEKARNLAEKALAMKGLTDIQKATAHFVASACSVRLGEAVPAEEHFNKWEQFKSALPEGHQAFKEEHFLIDGLNKLE